MRRLDLVVAAWKTRKNYSLDAVKVYRRQLSARLPHSVPMD